MAKILEFKRVARKVETPDATKVKAGDVEDDISAVLNDFSLTPANRRWILENMLMDMDDQLVHYTRELEKAEKRLETLVKSAEKEIAAAYSEYTSQVEGMTRAVKKLTKSSSRQTGPDQSADAAAGTPDNQTTPQ